MSALWNSPTPSPECRSLLWAVEMNLSTWALQTSVLIGW